MCIFNFFKLILIMILKCFNLHCSLPSIRGSGKERIQGKWTCLEGVLWSNSLRLCCLEINRSTAAAQSTCKHFTDTPVVQFNSIGIANTNQQLQHYLAETARPQLQHKSAGETLEEHQEKFWAVPLPAKQSSGKIRDPHYKQAKLRLCH